MIADTDSFSTGSYVLGTAKKNKYSSTKTPITNPGGQKLLLKLKDGFSFGTDDKFGKDAMTIAISLKERSGLVSALTTLETDCAEKSGNQEEKIMKCLYRKGDYPILYAKITPATQIRDANGKVVSNYGTLKKKRFGLNAVFHVESVFESEKGVTIQVRLLAAKILPDAPVDEEEMERLMQEI